MNSRQQPVPHEGTDATGLKHLKGTVSAARIDLNHLFGSFFVCLRDEPVLDQGEARHPDRQGFAAFGQLLSGYEVIERIMEHAEAGDFLDQEIPIVSVELETSNDQD
jgi:peptidyl-prolyl cis-trans isomerase A (cyclophilin A)